MDEGPGISDSMSSHQAAQKGSVVENISDDQELFLKVLENLKNAVNLKPDNHSVAQPKQQGNLQECITGSEPKQHNYQQEGIIDSGPITTVGLQKDLIRTDCTISTDESQLRSDSHEPSLSSKVTVSDKTKSLILQKINVSSEIDRNKEEGLDVKSKGTESQNKVGQGVENQVQISSIFSRQQDTSVNNLNVTVVGLNQHVNTNIDRESSTSSSKIAGFITKVQDTPNTNQSGKVRVLAPNTSPKQLHTCNQCDYYSENKNYLKQHIDLVHNNDRPYKCPYCEYAGKRSHALREHLIVHSNERPYQCKSCNATFRKKGHLTNHIKLHNSKRLVKCPLCKMLVYDTGENGLDAHLKNEHDTERLYGCDLCDHIAANEPEILQHLKTQHKSKLVAYRCDRCPFVTSNTADFNAHMDAHTMSNASVKLGDNKSGNVVAVATLPRETAVQEMPNTAVTVGKTDDTQTQAAVIKPVWIKCSECGFTAQDSEVIKKHMLEHLGMEVVPEKTQNHVQQILSPLKTNQKQSSQQTLSTSGPKKTVTVPSIPATNLDNLVQHQGRKLDMNSPVLVPVSDPALLKSLQSLPLGSLPSSAKLVQINPSLITSAIGPSNIIQQQANTAVNNTNIPTVVVSSQPYMDRTTPAASLKPSVNVTNTFSSPVVMSNQQVLPLQNNQMPKSNTYLKVIPVTNHQASTVMASKNPGVSVVASQLPAMVRPNGDSQLVTTNTVQAQQKLANIPKVPGFQLSQIPVPRNFTPTQVPKLPPEILSIGTTLDAVERRQTEVVKENVRPVDQKTAVLQESLANIQHLIEEQNKLNKKMGHPVVKLNSKGIPEQASKQNIVYYISPVEKQNTTIRADKMDGFTHDSNAGRFKCTLCGYTCEYQRTIKAHVWKHSGNKNIDYPMFQNGPLSIYDEGIVVNQKPDNEGIKETVNETKNINEVIITTEEPQSDVPLVPTDTIQTAGSKLPPFIVYDQTRISNVAPALANLLAARTMANMSKKSQEDGKDKEVDAAVKHIVVPQSNSHMIKPQQDNGQKEEVNNMGVSADSEQKSADSLSGYTFETMDGKLVDVPSKRHPKANVVVEAVNTVSSGYTGLQSQQNSPRITPAPRSPDSGVSELTADSKTTDDKSTSDHVSPIVKSEYGIDEGVQTRGSKRKLAERSGDGHNEKPDPNKRLRSALLEDSAVTLLSLLKKGPNYNPACPPKSGTVPPPSDTSRNVPSPSLEDSNSTGETEKPKSGISTSLLAVIEQLRERSKSDQDDEKTVLPSLPFVPKKASKRRSRRSSREDNESAAGIENVEQFDVDGQIKFRCKLCHYTNESTVLLKQHMRLHKPKQQFECSLCDLIAESSEALQDHMIQHCKVRTYQCKLCNQAFNYKSQLRAHMRMHNDQDILLCDFCDFETRSASALKAHTKSHLTKPPYKCDVCKEEFITSFNLRIHKREGCYTTIDKLGHFKCDKCDFTSLGRREMKNHQRAHLMKGLGNEHKVTYCDLTGLTLDQIQQHITDSQGELKTLKCDLCGFVAVSIRSLKSHMKRHVNDQRFVAQPLEQYKCNLCGYVCHHLPSLKSHMWRHAADQHYSYEFTNDVINAAIDFDSRIDAADTTKDHVANFKKLIFDKMRAKGLESTRNTQEESAAVCCWVTFRCCQCGFETINKAELNMHMTAHSDVIKWTLDVSEEERRQEDEIPMVVQEQVVPFMESNKAVPQIMNA